MDEQVITNDMYIDTDGLTFDGDFQFEDETPSQIMSDTDVDIDTNDNEDINEVSDLISDEIVDEQYELDEINDEDVFDDSFSFDEIEDEDISDTELDDEEDNKNDDEEEPEDNESEEDDDLAETDFDDFQIELEDGSSVSLNQALYIYDDDEIETKIEDQINYATTIADEMQETYDKIQSICVSELDKEIEDLDAFDWDDAVVNNPRLYDLLDKELEWKRHVRTQLHEDYQEMKAEELAKEEARIKGVQNKLLKGWTDAIPLMNPNVFNQVADFSNALGAFTKEQILSFEEPEVVKVLYKAMVQKQGKPKVTVKVKGVPNAKGKKAVSSEFAQKRSQLLASKSFDTSSAFNFLED